MNDSVMIKRLREGRQESFAKFFETYKNLVFYECNNILQNHSDAEEVSQDVFVEFFNNLDLIKDHTNLKLYIASLAKRRAIDLYRKKAKSPISYSDTMEDYGEFDRKVDPSLKLDECLSDIEAKIVSLKVIYDFSFKEIAEEMHLSLGQVQGSYYPAIKKLKQHYKKGN